MAMNIPGLQSFSSRLQQCGMRGIQIWPCCLVLVSGLVISAPLMAAAEYCDAIHAHHKVSLGYGNLQHPSSEISAGASVRLVKEQLEIDLSDKAISRLLYQRILPRFKAIFEGSE